MPELPEIEAWRRALDEPVSASPIEQRRAGAHRDAEDVRPAAHDARGPPPRGRAAARQAAPVPDRRRRARAAHPPHVRRAGCATSRPARRGRRRPRSGSTSRAAASSSSPRPATKKRAGVWLYTPEAAEAELAHLGPDALGLGAERLGEILARRLAPAARAAARPARDRRHRPRLGERDPAPRAALAVRALDQVLGPRRSSAWRPRSTSSCPRASSCASAARRREDVPRPPPRCGEPCHVCGTPIAQVDYEEHTIFYCPDCQTGGRVLKDRRMSRLLR